MLKTGTRVRLTQVDPSSKAGSSKEEAARRVTELQERMAALQIAFYAEHQRALLIVLQAMDTGGKDGAVKAICHGIDPNGIDLTNFKYPTPEEWDHDFLWRIHKAAPRKGMIGIWNRSHYEDVLVPKVQESITDKVWRARCEDIVSFERLLLRNGTTMLKFFLHISKEEQKVRLQSRLDNPEKHWKFNPGDLKARALWNKYMSTYEGTIALTATEEAPWQIVPANRKWARDLVLLEAVVAKLEEMKPQYPKPDFDPKTIIIP